MVIEGRKFKKLAFGAFARARNNIFVKNCLISESRLMCIFHIKKIYSVFVDVAHVEYNISQRVVYFKNVYYNQISILNEQPFCLYFYACETFPKNMNILIGASMTK